MCTFLRRVFVSWCACGLLLAAALAASTGADPPSLTLDKTLVLQDAALAVAWTPGGRSIVAGSRDGSVWVWDATDPLNVKPVTLPNSGGAFTRAVAVSPGIGTRLLSAGRDGTIRLWLIPDLVIGPSGNPEKLVLAPSPDGSRFVIGRGSSVRIVSLAGASAVDLPRPGKTAKIRAVAWGSDTKNDRVVAGDDKGELAVWLSSGATAPTTVATGTALHGVTFTPDGKSVLTASDDGKVQVWDITTSPPTAGTILNPPSTGGASPGSALAVAAILSGTSGTKAASAHKNNVIVVYPDLTGVTPPALLTTKGDAVRALAFVTDQRLLSASAGDNNLVDWDLTKPAMPQSSSTGLDHEADALAFDAPSKTLVAGLRNNNACLFDVRMGVRKTTTFPIGTQARTSRAVAFVNPDANLNFAQFLVGSRDGAVTLCPIPPPGSGGAPMLPLATFAQGGIDVFSAAWLPPIPKAAPRFATGSADGNLRVWDVTKPNALSTQAAHHRRVFAVVAWKTGNDIQIASSGDEPAVKGWDQDGNAKWKQPPNMCSPGRSVTCLAVNTGGTVLASGSDDQTIWTCNAANGTNPLKLAEHDAPLVALAFSPKNDKLLAAIDSAGNLILWDLDTPTNPVKQTIPAGSMAPTGLAWSPDASKLAVSCMSNRVITYQSTP